MRTLLIITVAAIVAGTSSFATAAQAPIPGVQAAAEETLTGCLTKGSGAAFILEVSDGTRVAVAGPSELAKHINQTVLVKGSMDRAGGVFRATAVESIETSCRG